MGIPSRLMSQTVTRIRPSTTTDTYGNTVRIYTVGPASSTSMTGWLQQDAGNEDRPEGRDALERLWTFITNETDIAGYDRIVFGSLTFEVEGPPAPAYNPAGLHHTEAKLRRVDG